MLVCHIPLRSYSSLINFNLFRLSPLGVDWAADNTDWAADGQADKQAAPTGWE